MNWFFYLKYLDIQYINKYITYPPPGCNRYNCSSFSFNFFWRFVYRVTMESKHYSPFYLINDYLFFFNRIILFDFSFFFKKRFFIYGMSSLSRLFISIDFIFFSSSWITKKEKSSKKYIYISFTNFLICF